MTKLMDLAKVIRSKNASINHITVDILFDDPTVYRRVRNSGIVTRRAVADLYGIDEARVTGVIFYDPGQAIKVNLRRHFATGDPGDHDVFGSQYNDPLFDLEIPQPTATSGP